MELDDLKIIWNEPRTAPADVEGDRARVMKIIQGSHRSIRRSFFSDILMALCINLAFVLVVIFFGGAVQKFLYKLVIITNLVSLPIYYRLYKSIQYLGNFDFGLDVKTNMTAFVEYYKKTLALYKWGTYCIIVALLVIFFMDESFLELPLWIKALIVGYLLLFLAISGWLVKKIYGQRISRIESYLQA